MSEARDRPAEAAGDPLGPAIASLHGEGRLRVWSLVITVFGDAAEPRGGALPTARLTALLGRLGVEPGAIRTALSRLARDGWLARERTGRNSLYRLTPRGRAEFVPATRRIYAPALAAPPAAWVLAHTTDPDGGRGRAPAGARPLGAGTWLWPAGSDRPVPPGWLSVTGTPAPVDHDLAETLLGAGERLAREALAAEAEALTRGAAGLSALDAMAGRTLLVHRWRRLVLRHPGLPPGPLAAALRLPYCRALVATAYRALLPASETWLDGPLDAATGPMPPAEPGFAERFRSGS